MSHQKIIIEIDDTQLQDSIKRLNLIIIQAEKAIPDTTQLTAKSSEINDLLLKIGIVRREGKYIPQITRQTRYVMNRVPYFRQVSSMLYQLRLLESGMMSTTAIVALVITIRWILEQQQVIEENQRKLAVAFGEAQGLNYDDARAILDRDKQFFRSMTI